MIGKKLYKGQYTQEEYTKVALWCNENNAHIEDKGKYYEVIKNEEYVPSLEEQLLKLEQEYNMPRVTRDIILANPFMYNFFIVERAKKLEEIAEQIRGK